MDPLPCPRCADALRKAGSRGQVDACPQDHGVFLDAAELARALDPAHARALLDAAVGSPVPTVACPRCDVAMREVRFAEVASTLDVCVRCDGAWVDPAALERVRDASLRPWRHASPDLHPTALRVAQGVVLGGFAWGGLTELWRDLLRR